MTPDGLGVDVVDLTRWKRMAQRHGHRLSTELAVPHNAIETHVGAAAFGLVECVVKATPGAGLWDTLSRAHTMNAVAAAAWRPAVMDEGLRELELLATSPGRWGVEALVTTGTCVEGQFAAAVVHGCVVVILARPGVPSWVAAVQIGQTSRGLLEQLAGRHLPGVTVHAPEGSAPWVGNTAASLAHDGGLVAAVLGVEVPWNR